MPLNTLYLAMSAQQTRVSPEKMEHSKDDLDFHLNILVLRMQDPNVHRYFAPGQNWLACALTKKTLEGAVSLADAIGVPDDVFDQVYG
jgi:hypothetical protein